MEENIKNQESITTSDKSESGAQETCKSNCCSKLSFYFSIISLLGVMVLFILYFFVKNDEGEINEDVSNIKNKNVSIGFVNSDSIMANYQLVKEMEDSLLAMQTKAESDFTAQQNTYQASVLSYQKKMQANELSITEATKTETQLTTQKEYLTQLYEDLSTELATEQAKLTAISQDSILNYIKRYNQKYKFDYILGYSSGGGILYANDSFDITKDVLEGLNKEYEKMKED